MQQTDPSDERSATLDESNPDETDLLEAEDDGPGIDWMVFMFRAAALVTFGATLIISVDLSRNRGGEWIEVMRLAMLPVIGSMLLLAAGELLDRRGD